LIERLIFEVVTEGIAYLKDTPGAITRFFKKQDLLSDEEIALLEDLFINKMTPTVIHGYARDNAKFPVYAITLGSENETQAFIGDEGAFIDDEESPDFGADEFAAIFGYQFNLMVYAQNPDVTLAYYQLLKQMVINGFPKFKANGLFDLRFSGADMAPDPAWVPAGLYVRRATLSCSREYTQPWTSSKLGRAWKVQSIHIDAAGAPGEDVGGVLTHVTFPDGATEEEK
jgi:hypothetical protein